MNIETITMDKLSEKVNQTKELTQKRILFLMEKAISMARTLLMSLRKRIKRKKRKKEQN